MARFSPFLPLIGGGHTRFQPVYVGDVAAAIARACAGHAKPGTVYELGGPEVVTFRELLDLTQEWSGRRSLYLRLPFWFAKLGALLTLPLPNSLRPLTVDQVRLLQRHNVVSEAADAEARTLAGLGIAAPRTMAAIVPAYLERFQPHGQFAHYRVIGRPTRHPSSPKPRRSRDYRGSSAKAVRDPGSAPVRRPG